MKTYLFIKIADEWLYKEHLGYKPQKTPSGYSVWVETNNSISRIEADIAIVATTDHPDLILEQLGK